MLINEIYTKKYLSLSLVCSTPLFFLSIHIIIWKCPTRYSRRIRRKEDSNHDLQHPAQTYLVVVEDTTQVVLFNTLLLHVFCCIVIYCFELYNIDMSMLRNKNFHCLICFSSFFFKINRYFFTITLIHELTYVYN